MKIKYIASIFDNRSMRCPTSCIPDKNADFAWSKISAHAIVSLTLVSVISGCATAPEKPVEQADPAPFVSDYPTRDRVEYVLNCVAQHGGLTYISQYACGCKIDKIAEKLGFAEYEAAKTFTYLTKGQTGDVGAALRDPAQSKDLRKRLKDAEEYAEKNCFVK